MIRFLSTLVHRKERKAGLFRSYVDFWKLGSICLWFASARTCVRACVRVCVCACACSCVCVCLVISNSLGSHGLQPTRLLCALNFPGKHTGVGCHFLLQGIFLTQGLNPGLPHCSQTLSSEPNCFNDFLFWKIFLFSSLEEKYSLQSKYTPIGKKLIFPIQKGKD